MEYKLFNFFPIYTILIDSTIDLNWKVVVKEKKRRKIYPARIFSHI